MDDKGKSAKTVLVQVEDCDCEFHHKISTSNAKEIIEFKDELLEMCPYFMQSIVAHTHQLIQKVFENENGDTGAHELILDGDQGVVVSDSDSDGAVNEDDRFRLAVPPVARAMQKLINDVNEALLKIRQKQPAANRKARVESDFDPAKMGLRFAFHEGLGFIEYYPVEEELEKIQHPHKANEGQTEDYVKALKPASEVVSVDTKKEPISRITCELKITKTWEEQNLEGIKEESNSDESGEGPKKSPDLQYNASVVGPT